MKTTPDRIELMQTFVRIVEAGSLSAAAAQMGATQPTVSRRLQALERSLGLRLLRRSTHAMTLTEDGQRCYAGAKDMLGSWDAFEAELRGASDVPEGTLRVVVPHAFGQQQLIGPLAEYLRRHSRVSVEWLLHDSTPDFISSGIDCAIHVGELSDLSVIAVKIAEIPRIVVAAPSVAGNAPVTDPAGLASLPWLALRTFYRDQVTLTNSDGETRSFAIRPRMSTDSLFALRSAALENLGACIASSWIVADDVAEGKLVHLAPQWQAAPLPVHLLYPYAHFYPARLRRFIDVLKAATLPSGMNWPAELGPA